MLPDNHPQRLQLNRETHARPPEPLRAPLRLSYLALFANRAVGDRSRQHVGDLAARFGATPPAKGDNHFSADLGLLRIKWEKHTEFVRYTFIVNGVPDDAFAEPALAAVPSDWLAAMPGQVIVATHATLLAQDADAGIELDVGAVAGAMFAGNTLAGSAIAGGAATALTDFQLHDDGFGRLLVLNRATTLRQAGRMLQRLLEIDTYRIMAMLALPVARELTPFLNQCERRLAQLTTALADTGADNDLDNDQALLDSLTRLAADIESRESDTHFRFSAAKAYYALVQQRIHELREQRIQGLQTFQEFTERRLAPAMNTCVATAGRQTSLTERVARVTQLLSTRVDIGRGRQNQALLASMDRRASLQLRLQETVEGLSIAAITYYIVGLIGYAAKGLKTAGVAVNPELVMGLSIPLVIVLIALGVRKIRKTVTGHAS